uniref:BTB domain-containing protein n=1 Tax=Parascaris univalens TaxID=6257 RepID=A0A915AVW6_PARUN
FIMRKQFVVQSGRSYAKRLETLLNVHPEKYRSRSNRPTRSTTPVRLEQSRSRSVDYLSPVVDMSDLDSRDERSNNGSVFPIIPEEEVVNVDIAPMNGISSSTPENSLITINVSGMKFQTFRSTLARYPETLLGNPAKRAQFWNGRDEEYFFDRHRPSFESILYIYQSHGVVKRPESVPIDIFLKEMKFFEMTDDILEAFWISEGYEKPEEAKMPENIHQRRVWELMEYPDSSLSARIMAFISIIVIIASIVSFCLETLPALKPVETDGARDWSNPFFLVELICIIWFTVELLLRFVSCPCKLTFMRSFLNIIDFIAIAPFFVNLLWSDASKSNSSMSFAVLRVLRLVRVFRIFKLSRHSVGLQILGKTFRASIQEFCLLIFFLAIALVLFSSGVYFAEQSEPDTKFTSIPASFWFVLIR